MKFIQFSTGQKIYWTRPPGIKNGREITLTAPKISDPFKDIPQDIKAKALRLSDGDKLIAMSQEQHQRQYG